MSLAILEILKSKNIKADVAAGLSLGEYSALIYSGLFSFEEGVKLVQKRGTYMQALVPEGEWSMAAIIGLGDEETRTICESVKSGFVRVANYNCNGQIAISGEKKAVREAMEKAKEAGARKAIELNTAGPFHTEKLKEASKELRKELDNVKINELKIPVIKNIDGMPYKQEDDIKQILADHIISPVKFTKTLDTMVEMEVDTFIEVGPGKVLSGFAKRINSDKCFNILNVNNVESLENAIEFVTHIM